jgi:hypothetical protein
MKIRQSQSGSPPAWQNIAPPSDSTAWRLGVELNFASYSRVPLLPSKTEPPGLP